MGPWARKAWPWPHHVALALLAVPVVATLVVGQHSQQQAAQDPWATRQCYLQLSPPGTAKAKAKAKAKPKPKPKAEGQ